MKFEFAKGAAHASLSAGPIFVLVFALSSLLSGNLSSRDAITLPFILLPILGVAVPVGAIIGVLPIAAGGFLMGWLGSCNPVARQPAFWALAGAVLAIPLAALLADAGLPGIIVQFAATGAVCALIVRRRTNSDDEAPPVPLNANQGEVK